MTKTIRLPDGYTGQTILFESEPIQRDGHLVKLRCAELGKEYLTGWKRTEDLWTRHPGPHKFTFWEHVSGWRVLHCGHPTANWPYWLQPPDGSVTVVSFNGYGFKSAEIARSVVDRIVSGTAKITAENCVPGIMCVPTITAYGKEL